MAKITIKDIVLFFSGVLVSYLISKNIKKNKWQL
jgi:hypothetical protein